MMTQTLALFLDAYREIQSKKMFWIVLGLNVFFVAAFGVLGVTDHGLNFLWFKPFLDTPDRARALYLYKMVFSNAVVGLWLTWIAAILALISTAGIFPDFLSSGSVDLYLARPISRVRLFCTKYAAALLFVLLQVSLFAVLSFFVLGLRAGLWEPGLFWSIPLVLLFFSYLYSICVLLGVLTRSTVASLLLTILAWLFIWAANGSENLVFGIRSNLELQRANMEDRLDALDRRIERAQAAAATQPPSTAPVAASAPAAAPPGGRGRALWLAPLNANATLPEMQAERTELVEQHDATVVSPWFYTIEHALHGFRSFVPKTGETTRLLDRVLFQDKELRQMAVPPQQNAPPDDEFATMNGPRARAVRAEMASHSRDDSVLWIIGTSLVFEAAVLAIAARHFSTRDF